MALKRLKIRNYFNPSTSNFGLPSFDKPSVEKPSVNKSEPLKKLKIRNIFNPHDSNFGLSGANDARLKRDAIKVDITQRPTNPDLLALGLGPINYDGLDDDRKTKVKQILTKQTLKPATGTEIKLPTKDLTAGQAAEQAFAVMDLNRRVREIQDNGGALPTKTFFDTFNEVKGDPEKFMGFVSSTKETKKLFEIHDSAKRVEAGEETLKDIALLYQFSTEADRDKTLGAKVADVLIGSIPFAQELYFTGGAFSVGKALTEKGIKATVENILKKKFKRNLGVKITSNIAGATLQTPLAGATRITAGTVSNLTPGVQVTQNELNQVNALIAKEGDELPKALLKAFGDQWVETVSEKSGGLFTSLINPVKNKLIKAAVTRGFLKANPNAKVSDFMRVLDRAGWNGLIGEMGEERLGEIGRAALGLEDYKLPTKDQLLVELVAFAIPGVAIGLADSASSKVEFTKEGTQKFVKEEIFPGQDRPGFVKVPGAKDDAEKVSTPLFNEETGKITTDLKKGDKVVIKTKNGDIQNPDVEGEIIDVSVKRSTAVLPEFQAGAGIILIGTTDSKQVFIRVRQADGTIENINRLSQGLEITRERTQKFVKEEIFPGQARPGFAKIPGAKDEDPLTQEAKKFKTADEFIKSIDKDEFTDITGKSKIGLVSKERFDGIDIRAFQSTVDAKGVEKWKKKIQAGERPFVTIEFKERTGNNFIIDGHTRLNAYFELGIDDIPTVDVTGKILKTEPTIIDIFNQAKPKVKIRQSAGAISEIDDLTSFDLEVAFAFDVGDSFEPTAKTEAGFGRSQQRQEVRLAKRNAKLRGRAAVAKVKEDFRTQAQIQKDKEATRLQGPTDFEKAEGINRSATSAEIKKAIKGESSRIVRLRQNTVLKNRLQSLSSASRTSGIFNRKQIKLVQAELTSLIQGSNLDLNDRAKFISLIKNVQTKEQLDKRIVDIKNRLLSLEYDAEIRKIKNEIRQNLKRSSVRRVNGKPVGKFTPEVQKVLDLLRGAINVTKAQAEERIVKNIQDNQGIPTLEIALQNRILSMVAGDIDLKSLKSLSEQINQMIESGKMMNALKKFNLQTEVQEEQAWLIDRITGGKGIDKGIGTFGRKKKSRIKQGLKSLGKSLVLDWHGLMKVVIDFNNSVLDPKFQKFGTLDQDNEYKNLTFDMINDIKTILINSFEIKNKNSAVHRKYTELSQEINFGKQTNAVGITEEFKMTRDEMIKMWMELHDASLIESFIEGNKFTDKMISLVNNEITPQEKAYGKAQFQLYKEQWEKINEVYTEIYGVELPFHEFYSPIRRWGFDADKTKGVGEFLIESVDRRAITSSSFILRKKNTLPIARQGSTAVLARYMKETNYFIAWAKQIRRLNSTLGDKTVQEAIIQEFGASTLNAVKMGINDLTTNGNIYAREIKIVDWFRTNFTIGALAIKPIIGIKQLVSTIAYLEKVGPIEFVAGIADFWRHPIKNYNILQAESVFIKTRSANMERDIKAAKSDDVFKQYKRKQNFMNAAMINVKIGDKGAIIVGSWTMRRAALKRGESLEDIIRAYEEFGSDTQQSSDISRQSQIQRGNSLEKLFTIFKSSPRQFLQKEINALRSIVQKDGLTPANVKKVARTLVIYHVLLPVTFQYIANLGGWDEDDKKEYIMAGLLGSFNGIFIFGDAIGGTLRAAFGLKTWSAEIPIIQFLLDIGDAIRKLDIGDIDEESILAAMGELLDAGNVTGYPTQFLKNFTIGLHDLIQGRPNAGIAEMAGWSPFHARQLGESKGVGVEKEVKLKNVKLRSGSGNVKLKPGSGVILR